MQLTVGRALSVLAGVWAARDAALVMEWEGVTRTVGSIWTLLWVGAALVLWRERLVWIGGAILSVLSITELMWMQQWPDYGLILLAWAGVCVFVTRGRSEEALLAIRVLVSSVYVFAGLSKLQPSWLSGENLHHLLATRPQANLVLGALNQEALLLLAFGTVIMELWLGVGLWFRATRSVTAILGILLHCSLIALATRGGAAGVLHLVVLNFGLVLLYVSFFRPLRLVASPRGALVVLAGGTR